MKKIRNVYQCIRKILMCISTEKTTKYIIKSIENYSSLTSFILIILSHFKNTILEKKNEL